MSLAQATALSSSRCQSAVFAMLHDWCADPVDARITSDGLMRRINEDDFVVLEGGILVDPVGVEDTEVGATATDTLLGNALEVARWLKLIDSLGGRLSANLSLSDLALATTTANPHSVNDETLLGLVSETASLVWARWTRGAVNDVKLAVFPAADAKDEAEDVTLLFLVDFFEVFVGSHLDGWIWVVVS